MRNFEYGFAAGCEAVAVPRRQRPDLCPGYAPGLGFAREFRAKGRTKGIAQIEKTWLRRGEATASHPAAKPFRREPMTFEAKQDLPDFD